MRRTIYLLACLAFLALSLQSCCDCDKSRKVYASEYGVILDSDVYAGGGTDQTAVLQEILDKAPVWGRLHLVLDGAALISRPLEVHSNTTIECPDQSCGVFLADSSSCCCISNADRDDRVIKNHNIKLLGGVYNNNSPHQKHHVSDDSFLAGGWVFGMCFVGVENFVMKDVTIANQRTFGLTMVNWKNVYMENIFIDRRERVEYQNQDGLHFFGPGKNLVVRNVHGNSGDDFLAIAPDELDKVSSIDGVLIEGVYLDDVDQAIRILCQGKGRVDNVTIRDVYGTYKSFGFTINPWFESEGGGNFGNIVIENVNLTPLKPCYTYTKPYLFKLGGNIESLSLRNITVHNPQYCHQLLIAGTHYMRDYVEPELNPTKIGRLVIDGLYIDETDPAVVPDSYVCLKSGKIDLLSLNNIVVRRPGIEGKKGCFVDCGDGYIGEILKGPMVSTPSLKTFTTGPKLHFIVASPLN